MKIYFGAVAFLLGGLVVYVMLQPAGYRIHRELLIAAPPAAIFPFLESSEKMDEWMPWKEVDPQVQMTYSGPASGIGATSSWDSPGQMGTGSAVISALTPNVRVQTTLTYSKPMAFSQLAEFTLLPVEDSTLVTWSVTGESPFLARLMCTLTLTNMDKLVGSQFERGLKNLRHLVEQSLLPGSA